LLFFFREQVKPSAAFRISSGGFGGMTVEVLVNMNPVPGLFVEAALLRDAGGNMWHDGPRRKQRNRL